MSTRKEIFIIYATVCCCCDREVAIMQFRKLNKQLNCSWKHSIVNVVVRRLIEPSTEWFNGTETYDKTLILITVPSHEYFNRKPKCTVKCPFHQKAVPPTTRNWNCQNCRSDWGLGKKFPHVIQYCTKREIAIRENKFFCPLFDPFAWFNPPPSPTRERGSKKLISLNFMICHEKP